MKDESPKFSREHVEITLRQALEAGIRTLPDEVSSKVYMKAKEVLEDYAGIAAFANRPLEFSKEQKEKLLETAEMIIKNIPPPPEGTGDVLYEGAVKLLQDMKYSVI